MNSDAEMLQAMEHLADQIDRLAPMLDECVTLTRAGVPISARSIDRYAAELERLTRGSCAAGRGPGALSCGHARHCERPLGGVGWDRDLRRLP